jgi:predicted nucleotidyltransferase
MNIMELIKNTGIEKENVIAIYRYGSHVYGTAGKSSDEDYIVITRDQLDITEQKAEYIDVTIYSRGQFVKQIEEHEISALECLFLPEEHVIYQTEQFEVKIDRAKLRRSLAQKASNSFVKAKKKLTIEADYNLRIAWKSLFHSLRIPMFGVQLAKDGKISDYACANHYLAEIEALNETAWEPLKEKYQPIFNAVSSEFKRHAPKQ